MLFQTITAHEIKGKYRKDWGQEEEEKGMTEGEMVGWHHRLDGHGFGWIPGVGDGQGGLACYSSCGCKELDMTEGLNWNELNWTESYPIRPLQFMTSFNLNYLLRALSPHTITLRVKASTYEFWECTSLSIAYNIMLSTFKRKVWIQLRGQYL